PAFNFYDQSWKHFLKENMHHFDAFLLSRWSVCHPILTFLRNNNYHGNVIYFGHDLGFRRLELEAETKGVDELKKQAKKVKAAEDFMYQNADNSLVLSHSELEYLQKYIKKPLHYVPAYFFDPVKAGINFKDREGILFVGGFN